MSAAPSPGMTAVVVALLVAAAVLVAPARSARPAEVAAGDARPSWRTRWSPGGDRRESGRVSEADVIESLALLALTFRTGLATWDVLEAVSARCGEAAAAELRQVAAALRWGASDDEAWGAVDERWVPAARAIALAGRAGVPPSPLLVRAADDLGSAELERLEVRAAKATVRLVLPLGLVLLPAFVLTTVLPIVAALARQVLAVA